MAINNSYPSYIPKKWIHYVQHGKRKRIRKKYQNRILRYVRCHERDIETATFLCNHASQEFVSTLREALTPVVEKAGEVFKNLSNIANKILHQAELEKLCSYIDDVDKPIRAKDSEENNEDKEEAE